MFENVPDWLAEKVKGLNQQLDTADRERVCYAAAGWTIAWYLRLDIQSAEADGFFLAPGPKETDGIDVGWNAHVNRAVLIAETLFLLRNSEGFSEQRKRLEKRSPHSTFFELLAAKQFLKAGFQISARPETGVKREDFDFTAVRGEEVINVEVTALEAKECSEVTILNALNHKRSQLPNTAAAVIYCSFPENWLHQPRDWDRFREDISNRFLRGTRRINAVVFWVQENRIIPDGVFWSLTSKHYLNKNPRIPVDLRTVLESGKRTEVALEALTRESGLDQLVEESYQSEFFRWVDHLVPRKKTTDSEGLT